MFLYDNVFLFLAAILLKAGNVQSTDIEINDLNGTISDSFRTAGTSQHSKTWLIRNPSNQTLEIEIEYIEFESKICGDVLRITEKSTGKVRDVCKDPSKDIITINSDAEVYFFVWSTRFYNNEVLKFKLNFRIDFDIEGARQRAIQWLLSKQSPSWGWKDKNPKAIIALYLSNGATFNGTDCQEELMVKQGELSVATSLMQNPISNEDLSTLINAMLISCHSPRRFFGQDLVKRLYNQIEQSTADFTHPAAYLAVCNANMAWPHTAMKDLTKVLSSESIYPFVTDIQAFAIMAMACRMNQSVLFKTDPQNVNLVSLYEKTLKKFKQNQLEDSSFGNVHTTALITQALIASGQQYVYDWRMQGAINFLIKALRQSSEDFLATYLSLPLFNYKTLVDIHKVNCTGNPRNKADLVSEIHDYIGLKIQVQYSLYIGDKRDVIYTITLRVPQNFTGFEVMQLAAAQDPKYEFKWEKRFSRMYVYEISKKPNDPESGKFWLLYLGSTTNVKVELTHHSIEADKLVLNDGDHFVMWYRSATI